MKKCPYCAEEIQDASIKCRYCLSDLNPVKDNDVDLKQNVSGPKVPPIEVSKLTKKPPQRPRQPQSKVSESPTNKLNEKLIITVFLGLVAAVILLTQIPKFIADKQKNNKIIADTNVNDVVPSAKNEPSYPVAPPAPTYKPETSQFSSDVAIARLKAEIAAKERSDARERNIAVAKARDEAVQQIEQERNAGRYFDESKAAEADEILVKALDQVFAQTEKKEMSLAMAQAISDSLMMIRDSRLKAAYEQRVRGAIDQQIQAAEKTYTISGKTFKSGMTPKRLQTIEILSRLSDQLRRERLQ